VKLLLDTHSFIWSLTQPDRLSATARSLLSSRQNDVLLSTVVVWEIAIKAALGKLPVQPHIRSWLPKYIQALGYRVLPVDLSHAVALEDLPAHHRDPFDRLLIAQARVEQATLVSRDAILARYDVPVIWN